jgi:esterase/lipase
MFHSRKFYYTIFVIGALYVLLIQQFFQNEARYLLKSPTYTNETTYNFDVDFQELNLSVNKELNLNGIWFNHETKKAIVLLFPDLDLDIRQIEISKNHYYKHGFDVLISAYRGTAKSTGLLKNEDDLFSDAKHWYHFAKSQFPEKEIVIAGQGFGASIAAELAGNNQAKILILKNPAFSFSDYQSKTRFWWLPYSYFTSFSLNTWEYIRKTTSKIILIQDETKKGQKISLTNYIKSSDKSYWLNESDDNHFSFQTENSLFFDMVLDSLFQNNNATEI